MLPEIKYGAWVMGAGEYSPAPLSALTQPNSRIAFGVRIHYHCDRTGRRCSTQWMLFDTMIEAELCALDWLTAQLN